MATNDWAPAVKMSKEEMSASVEEVVVPKVVKSKPRLKEFGFHQVWDWIVDFFLDPLNVAMVFMTIVATPPMLMTVLINTGALNKVSGFQTVQQRDDAEELCTQIVNSLFFLMCLIFHPIFFRQSFQLYRWQPRDIVALRHEYCKNGKRKPQEWFHISVIVWNLHITCFLTYGLAIIYWVFPEGHRDGYAGKVALFCLIGSFVAPVLAGVWAAFSPLAGDSEVDGDGLVVDEYISKGGKLEIVVESLSQDFLDHHRLVENPPWEGSIFPGCCNSPRIACFVCLFPWCIFGGNQEVSGMGHRLVTTFTFILIMFGPMIIFEIAAHTFKQVWLEDFVVIMGVWLGFFGLLYGAIWRRKMQDVYKLPESKICCGSSTITDGFMWLFCPYCALCQETRTVEHYECHNGKFYERTESGALDALPAEDPLSAPRPMQGEK